MIRYRLHTALGEVIVELDGETAEGYGDLRYIGDAAPALLVSSRLEVARGPRGYLIGSRTLAGDLRAVLESDAMALYHPERIETR